MFALPFMSSTHRRLQPLTDHPPVCAVAPHCCWLNQTAPDGTRVSYALDGDRRYQLFKLVSAAPVLAPAEVSRVDGMLYAARFGVEGHGLWLPLLAVRAPEWPRLDAITLIRLRERVRQVEPSSWQGVSALSETGPGSLQLRGAIGTVCWREALGDPASLSFSWNSVLERDAA